MIRQSVDSVSTFYKTLPNKLTIARIACVPVLLLLYPWGIAWLEVVAATVFAGAAITDYLDGYFARKYDAESDFGKLLDPVADKLLITTGILLLVESAKLYVAVGVVLIGRELIVSGLRLIAMKNGLDLQVKSFGKVKTAVQATGITCLMLPSPFLGLQVRQFGYVAIWLAVLLSLYSAYLYFEDYRHSQKKLGT
jgi:CDP-diacylglycerol---glycerol-3-phosphate 3-phosphatidyltransferase